MHTLARDATYALAGLAALLLAYTAGGLGAAMMLTFGVWLVGYVWFIVRH